MAQADTVEQARRRKSILVEAKRIQRNAEFWTETYRKDAINWRRINASLIVIAAVLAAVSAGSGLASLTSQTVSGLIALGAASFSGAATALGASTRAALSQTTSATDSELADHARAFVRTAAEYVALPEVVRRWELLCQERTAVVTNAPVTQVRWYWHPRVGKGRKRKA